MSDVGCSQVGCDCIVLATYGLQYHASSHGEQNHYPVLVIYLVMVTQDQVQYHYEYIPWITPATTQTLSQD